MTEKPNQFLLSSSITSVQNLITSKLGGGRLKFRLREQCSSLDSKLEHCSLSYIIKDKEKYFFFNLISMLCDLSKSDLLEQHIKVCDLRAEKIHYIKKNNGKKKK